MLTLNQDKSEDTFDLWLMITEYHKSGVIE